MKKLQIYLRTYLFFLFLHTITTKKYINLEISSHNRGYEITLTAFATVTVFLKPQAQPQY